MGKIENMIADKKKQYDDKNFFSSPALQSALTGIVAAISSRYKQKIAVDVVYENTETVAYTDNKVIVINAACELVTAQKTREMKYQTVLGLLAHELGHILYTDFTLSEIIYDSIENKHKMCLVDNPADYEEINTFLKTANKTQIEVFMSEFVHRLRNIIEDAYIEEMMMFKYPGSFKSGLKTVGKTHIKTMPTLAKMIKANTHEVFCIMQLILAYAKYGVIKLGKTKKSHIIVKMFKKCVADIELGITNHSAKERYIYSNKLLLVLWPYIFDYLKNIKEQDTQEKQKLTGETTISTDDTKPLDIEGDEHSNTDENAFKKAVEGKRETAKQKLEASDESEECNSEETEVEDRADEVEGDGGIEYTETEAEFNKDTTAEINSIINKMAETDVYGELETQRIWKLQNFANSISYSAIHHGVRFYINRFTFIPDTYIDRYNQIIKDIKPISMRLQRTVAKALKDKREGYKRTNLMFGRRLEGRALMREDGRVFSKTNLPNDEPSLAVGVLVDESGSMITDKRYIYAQMAALLLHDFCEGLNIPCCIYGHTADKMGKNTVSLFSYVEFEKIDKNDKYRLMDIRPRNNNRDGAAITFLAEKLAKRPETQKLLIVINDGNPYAYNYSGKSANEDIIGIKHHFAKRHITMFAASIGSDKEAVKEIYGNGYLDITNLNSLPVTLTDLVISNLKF